MEAFLLMAIALLGFSDVGEKGYVGHLMMMTVFGDRITMLVTFVVTWLMFMTFSLYLIAHKRISLALSMWLTDFENTVSW